MAGSLHAKSKGVVHHSAHRTRLRVPKGHRSVHKMDEIASALRKTKGIKSVEVNHKTGSILLHHEEHPAIFNVIEKTLEDSSSELLECLVEGSSPEILGLSMAAGLVRNLFSGNGVKNKGAALPSLKTLAPLAFIAAGIMRIRRGRGEDLLMTISPIVLFYYAFDLYWKFNTSNSAMPNQDECASPKAITATANP